jgi:hypothetical protein
MKAIRSCFFILGVVLNTTCLQAHPPCGINHQPIPQTNIQRPDLCPCGCGCVAPCNCGCTQGRPCTCHR